MVELSKKNRLRLIMEIHDTKIREIFLKNHEIDNTRLMNVLMEQDEDPDLTVFFIDDDKQYFKKRTNPVKNINLKSNDKPSQVYNYMEALHNHDKDND